MEETYNQLSERVMNASAKQPDIKYMVGIAGPPGAGKSTVAREVASRANQVWHQQNPSSSTDIAIAVPMDGFHLYKRDLDAMEDPVEAYARRGAPWTFDPFNLRMCLTFLLVQQRGKFPSFDHGVGDPVEDDIVVTPEHKIVLVEGNYLLLEDGEWANLSSMFNETWFIDVDINTAMRRVEKRHITTGKSEEEARKRVEYNDRPNAELILNTKHRSDLLISSVDYS